MGATIGDIADVHTKRGLLRMHLRDHPLEPEAALGAHVMRIVDLNKSEAVIRRCRLRRAERAGPEPQTEQRRCTELFQRFAPGHQEGIVRRFVSGFHKNI